VAEDETDGAAGREFTRESTEPRNCSTRAALFGAADRFTAAGKEGRFNDGAGVLTFGRETEGREGAVVVGGGVLLFASCAGASVRSFRGRASLERTVEGVTGLRAEFRIGARD
jgi:hypothetical protein